jgi:hypothetical protein
MKYLQEVVGSGAGIIEHLRKAGRLLLRGSVSRVIRGQLTDHHLSEVGEES